jgi:hypothetical protein
MIMVLFIKIDKMKKTTAYIFTLFTFLLAGTVAWVFDCGKIDQLLGEF